MLSRVKCALRFFLMRNASDFRPQGSTLVTEPPCAAICDLSCSVSASTCCGGHVLARQIDMLVKSHVRPFLSLSRPARSPSSPGKARTGSFEGGNTGSRSFRALPRANARAFRSAPSGTLRSGSLIERSLRRASEIALTSRRVATRAAEASALYWSENRRVCRSRSIPASRSRRFLARAPRASRRVIGSSPGIAAARMRVRSGPGLTSMTRMFDVLTRLGGVGAGERVERGLGGRVEAPIGAQVRAARRARGDERDPARRRAAQQRVERADQPPVGGDVDARTSSQAFGSSGAAATADAEHAGVADEGVEPAPASIERLAEPIDRGVVAQVERNERRRAPRRGGARGSRRRAPPARPACGRAR